jgi:hypothetical protein
MAIFGARTLSDTHGIYTDSRKQIGC